ncbi:hypothetical protein [Cupriavidus sp. H18C2]|uniref:hypothetical protein n=1 Tax=Cupriavidus sp. H18C2 TaxID=3241602 RepID=UPI003BF7D8BF
MRGQQSTVRLLGLPHLGQTAGDVAPHARWNEIAWTIVQLLLIQVIDMQACPIDTRATPVALMRTSANRVVEHAPVLIDTAFSISKRVGSSALHDIPVRVHPAIAERCMISSSQSQLLTVGGKQEAPAAR